MRLILTQQPSGEPVTLEEAKSFLRVDGVSEDVLIQTMIGTARDIAERYTRRAILTQKWNLILDDPGSPIKIPKPPLQKIDKISVIQEDGAEIEVSSSIYMVSSGGIGPGRVKLKSGCSWPLHRGFESFIIEFTAGWTEVAKVPGVIIQGILVTLGHLFENRQSEEMSDAAKKLLSTYKIWLV